MMNGERAKVEPTERSNSPAMMSMVMPMAISPSSGMVFNITKRFSWERNWPFDQ